MTQQLTVLNSNLTLNLSEPLKTTCNVTIVCDGSFSSITTSGSTAKKEHSSSSCADNLQPRGFSARFRSDMVINIPFIFIRR